MIVTFLDVEYSIITNLNDRYVDTYFVSKRYPLLDSFFICAPSPIPLNNIGPIQNPIKNKAIEL